MTAPTTVLVIGGPTASGKSGLALSVAKLKNGAIINADSMQVYNGLPLLTAQPSREDFAAAPHRLYARLAPDDLCSAARWRDMALAEIGKAAAEGFLPIVTGGTGFYINTLVKGISPIPDVPPEVREKAILRQKELGNPGFHTELQKRDPAMGARLDPFNTQRLVRAFEVLEATGKSLAAWQDLPPVPPPAHLKFIVATLLPPRDRLYAQCDGRFTQMLKAGALEEVSAFKKTATPAMPLCKALGYPELAAHLDGKLSLEEAAGLSQQATRNYAKRQVTWFRHQIKADIVLEEASSQRVLALIS